MQGDAPDQPLAIHRHQSMVGAARLDRCQLFPQVTDADGVAKLRNQRQQ
jgi:hypothetical protein